jgi:hypothetical protein
MSIISEYDLKDGLFIRRDTQNVDEILKSNALERNSGENQNRFANARKVASIPLVILENLKTRDMKDGGPIDYNLVGQDPDHTARFVRWLNDRDNLMFRTSEANLGHGNRYL